MARRRPRKFARNPKAASIKYGTVPPFKSFWEHVSKWRDENGRSISAGERPVYKMTLSKAEGDAVGFYISDVDGVKTAKKSRGVQFTFDTAYALWQAVSALAEGGDEAMMEGYGEGEVCLDVADAIMHTVGYEWI